MPFFFPPLAFSVGLIEEIDFVGVVDDIFGFLAAYILLPPRPIELLVTERGDVDNIEVGFIVGVERRLLLLGSVLTGEEGTLRKEGELIEGDEVADGPNTKGEEVVEGVGGIVAEKEGVGEGEVIVVAVVIAVAAVVAAVDAAPNAKEEKDIDEAVVDEVEAEEEEAAETELKGLQLPNENGLGVVVEGVVAVVFADGVDPKEKRLLLRLGVEGVLLLPVEPKGKAEGGEEDRDPIEKEKLLELVPNEKADEEEEEEAGVLVVVPNEREGVALLLFSADKEKGAKVVEDVGVAESPLGSKEGSVGGRTDSVEVVAGGVSVAVVVGAAISKSNPFSFFTTGRRGGT